MIMSPLQLASLVSLERINTRLVAELTNKAPRRLIDFVLHSGLRKEWRPEMELCRSRTQAEPLV
jgi:hypothetical protein